MLIGSVAAVLAAGAIGYLAAVRGANRQAKSARDLEDERRETERQDVAVALYHELFELAPMCRVAHMAWKERERKGDLLIVKDVRKFRFQNPVIYSSLPDRLGLLPIDARSSLIIFHNFLGAIQRDIDGWQTEPAETKIKDKNYSTTLRDRWLRARLSAADAIESLRSVIVDIEKIDQVLHAKYGHSEDILELLRAPMHRDDSNT